MLPLPGTPSYSFSRFKAQLQTQFEGADLRVCLAFWLFGLINNILYVIILTAALDLVGPNIPKATILLASVIPGLATKLSIPYIIHLIPYSSRILIFSMLSTSGMLLVALSPTTAIGEKVVGIVLANISSGAGEVNFLSLTHYYGGFSLAAWGSGTGGAGLVGAGAYALATNELGVSVRGALLGSAVLPVIMLGAYFGLLPRGVLDGVRAGNGKDHRAATFSEEDDEDTRETAGLLDPSHDNLAIHHKSAQTKFHSAIADFKAKLNRARSLILPYMAPLFLVYLAEYTINLGVAPTLLFPLDQTPFTQYRSFYPTYSALYQGGVFLSRSSLALFQIRNLYTPTILQILNLAVLTLHAMFNFIPSVWVIFAVVFWEGLLGGLVYVSTYARVREDIEESEREFSLGAVSVSDAFGILVAGFVGVGLERGLCEWQVQHGRDWCRRL